jgi:hypothetical protein
MKPETSQITGAKLGINFHNPILGYSRLIHFLAFHSIPFYVITGKKEETGG